MKLLIGFIAVCVFMLAIALWSIVDIDNPAPAERPPVADSRPSPAPSDPAPAMAPHESQSLPAEPGRADPAPGSASPDDLEPATSDVPSVTTDVRWVDEAGARRAIEQLTAAKAVLADDPDHPLALRDACEALTTLRRWSDVADTLTRLCRIAPDDDTLTFEHAVVLMRLRRWMEALPLLKRVVERQPDHARAWFNLAVTRQALGHLADARLAWDRAIALRPDPAALARRGEVLLDLREWAAAAADFQAVLAQKPADDDDALNLALAWWRMGRLDDARDCLRAVLGRHPRHVPALNRLADIAWAACQADPIQHALDCREAVECWRQSLEAAPDQPTVRARLETAQHLVPSAH